MSVVEFGTPPVSKREQRRQRWQQAADELQANPNTWGKVGNYAPGTATAIRKGLYRQFLKGMPDGMSASEWMRLNWEVHAVKVQGHSRDEIWVRWLGGDQAR